MKQVLVVDDNDDIRLLLRHMLNREFGDCVVTEAASGNLAMQLASERRFDLIISDYVMPNGTAEDLLHFVREIGLSTPFIFYSGDPPSRETRSELVSCNCVYIEKPEFSRVVRIAAQMIH